MTIVSPTADRKRFTSTVVWVAALNQRRAKKLLEHNGWRETRGGKHVVKMEKEGERPITLPYHRGRDYSKSLAAAILKQAGLEREAS